MASSSGATSASISLPYERKLDRMKVRPGSACHSPASSAAICLGASLSRDDISEAVNPLASRSRTKSARELITAPATGASA
jgi:hypothetical protein